MLFLKADDRSGAVTYINLNQVTKMIYWPDENATDVYFSSQTVHVRLLGNITDQTIAEFIEFKGENDG